LDPEDKPIQDALGQVLFEEVKSSYDIPPMDNSAMDGFAVQYDSIAAVTPDSPAMLVVTGEVAAGHLPSVQVEPGTAVRIMTGATIPPGADTVVPFEDTDELERKGRSQDLSHIAIQKNNSRGKNIRPAGEDITRGELVLAKGTQLRPSEIGVLASIGLSSVKVIRRPVVSILATGDELVEPGTQIEAGKIYNSNSYSIAASVLRYGGIPIITGIAMDNLKSMNEMLNTGLNADLIITSAGVSRGDYDIVKEVLSQRGKIAFWSVRMRPAKPLAFGVLHATDGRQVPHVGLPGNPVSALVAFEEFIRPALLKMLGKANLVKPTIEAILEDPINNDDGRRTYARAIVTKRGEKYFARLTGPQGSNILTSMARANGLAICPENIPMLKPGEKVQVQMLDWEETNL